MNAYRFVLNQDTYLEHHGVKGQKWGVIRTPEQLGHRKKTYEFKPYETYKTTIPSTGERLTASFRLPVRALSESIKRHQDPEYKKKSDEFIRDNKEMLTFRLLMETGSNLPALIYIMKAESKSNAPRMRTMRKNLMEYLKGADPNISERKLSQLIGVNKAYIRDLEKDFETPSEKQ